MIPLEGNLPPQILFLAHIRLAEEELGCKKLTIYSVRFAQQISNKYLNKYQSELFCKFEFLHLSCSSWTFFLQFFIFLPSNNLTNPKGHTYIFDHPDPLQQPCTSTQRLAFVRLGYIFLSFRPTCM